MACETAGHDTVIETAVEQTAVTDAGGDHTWLLDCAFDEAASPTDHEVAAQAGPATATTAAAVSVKARFISRQVRTSSWT